MVSLCHPWFTTTNISYRCPILETSATALCGPTGISVLYLSWIKFCIILLSHWAKAKDGVAAELCGTACHGGSQYPPARWTPSWSSHVVTAKKSSNFKHIQSTFNPRSIHVQSTFNSKYAKMQIISNNGAKLWHFGTSRCFICINFGCFCVVDGFENTRSSAHEKLENDVDTWRKTRHETTARLSSTRGFRHLQTSLDIFRHSMETFEETLTRWQQNPENKCYKTLRMWTKNRKASEKHQKSIKVELICFFSKLVQLRCEGGLGFGPTRRTGVSDLRQVVFVLYSESICPRSVHGFHGCRTWLDMTRCPDCFRLSLIFIYFPLFSSVFMSWNSGVFCL